MTAGCAYKGDEPIKVQMDILFDLGRGPQAAGDQRTYRYWVAVTERNEAVLAKEYFDLPVDFDGRRTALGHRGAVGSSSPAPTTDVSGGNFEVLVGFDVTPEMAEFNRDGQPLPRQRRRPAAAPATRPGQQ